VKRIRASVVLLTIWLSMPLMARNRPAPSFVRDGNYAAALAVANRFLQAWQSQNQEDGLFLLSDAAKQHVSEERLQEFFEHGSVAAYEIERGKALSSRRYTFPVVLLGVASGGGNRMRPHLSQIVVARTDSDDWAVERLP
jgi:hypothetical protein